MNWTLIFTVVLFTNGSVYAEKDEIYFAETKAACYNKTESILSELTQIPVDNIIINKNRTVLREHEINDNQGLKGYMWRCVESSNNE